MQAFIERIFSLQKFGIKLGLASTTALLKKLNHPERGLPCAHIAGTNGKGSTGAMLEAIALEAGLQTGYFSSPHLTSFNERFRLNGKMIGNEELLRLGQEVWAAMGAVPCTFFEFTTAMAFLYFSRAKVDIAIMETGMGGRFDSTNLCEPLLSIITNIGLDHQQYLGRTIAAIANDKAGIIKPKVPLLHGSRQKSAARAIEARAMELASPVYALGREVKLRRRGETFYLQGLGLPSGPLSTNLRGLHQPFNAALAAAGAKLLATRGIAINNSHIQNGLGKVNWPGRLERLMIGQTPLWLDGAHNLAGVRALLNNINLLKEGRRGPLCMVLGIMADKDLRPMLKSLLPAANQVIFTQPDYARACPAAELAKLAMPGKGLIEPSLPQAIDRALSQAGEQGQVLITGSLFTVGQARAIITGQHFQPL